jgi:hypothetical protein
MTELLSRISRILPSYPFEAPQSTPVPYCVYVKNDTPVHTKDGICGYEGTLTISIYAATLSVVNDLASKIVDALDSQDIGGEEYYYDSSDAESFSDIGLFSKNLTFNTLR